ncbi:CagY family CD-EC repeat-containing protein [Bordetella tumulicola]
MCQHEECLGQAKTPANRRGCLDIATD